MPQSAADLVELLVSVLDDGVLSLVVDVVSLFVLSDLVVSVLSLDFTGLVAALRPLLLLSLT